MQSSVRQSSITRTISPLEILPFRSSTGHEVDSVGITNISIVSVESSTKYGDNSEGDCNSDDCSSLLSFDSHISTSSPISDNVDHSSFTAALSPESQPRLDHNNLPKESSSCLVNKGNLRPYPNVINPECHLSNSTTRSRHGISARYRKERESIGSLVPHTKSFTSDLSTVSSTLSSNSLRTDFSTATQSCVSSVTFANECSERCRVPRFSNSLVTIPSSFTLDSRTQSCPILNKEITVTSSSADSDIFVSTSASSNSHMSRITSLSALSTISETVEANLSIIEDYAHSPRAARVSDIKRKMRSMEIQHYRTKCIRSLRKSMELTKKINISLEDEKSPRRLVTPSVVEHKQADGITQATGHLRYVMEVARDILLFNIVIALIYVFLLPYKDSIVNAIQNLNNHRGVRFSS